MAVGISIVALVVHIWALRFSGLPLSGLDFWRIDRDQSLSEHFEYAMLVGAGCAYLATAMQRRTLVLLFPAVLCFGLFLDNAIQLHERTGQLLLPAQQAAGELIYAGVGAIGISAVVLYLLRTVGAFEKQALVGFGFALACFGVFAVGVDALHTFVIEKWPRYDNKLGAIEDFGEMVSICLLFAVAVHGWRVAAAVDGDVVFAE